MRKLNFKEALFAMLSLVMVVAFTVLTLPAAAGITLATVIAGAGVTTDSSRSAIATLDMEDISQTVTEILPARVPMNKIMREIRKARKVESEIVRYYSVTNKSLTDVPDSSASGAGTSVSVPCKAYTYSSGDGLTSIWMQPTIPQIWSKDQTVILFNHPAAATIASGTPTNLQNVVFWVRTKTGNVVELVPLNGSLGTGANAAAYVVPTFAASASFVFAGKAMPQLAMQTNPIASMPTANEQYCQNFMAQIEESTFEKMTKKEVNFGFADYEKQNIWNMAVEEEISFLFGAKDYRLDSTTNDYRRFTEGITRRGINNLTYGTGSLNTTFSNTDYLNALEAVYTGNNGSDTRVLFAGAGLLKSLHTVESFQKQVDGKNPVVKWGVKFKEINSNFGDLLVMQHPLFKELGLTDYGLILDMAHIEKQDFIPMKVEVLDLRTSGQRNSEAKVIQEVSALLLTNPDCHGIIKPKA